jgi:hypothetical protein
VLNPWVPGRQGRIDIPRNVKKAKCTVWWSFEEWTIAHKWLKLKYNSESPKNSGIGGGGVEIHIL